MLQSIPHQSCRIFHIFYSFWHSSSNIDATHILLWMLQSIQVFLKSPWLSFQNYSTARGVRAAHKIQVVCKCTWRYVWVKECSKSAASLGYCMASIQYKDCGLKGEGISTWRNSGTMDFKKMVFTYGGNAAKHPSYAVKHHAAKHVGELLQSKCCEALKMLSSMDLVKDPRQGRRGLLQSIVSLLWSSWVLQSTPRRTGRQAGSFTWPPMVSFFSS